MHNFILIHAGNTPDSYKTVFLKENIIDLDYEHSDDTSIDHYIDRNIVSVLEEKEEKDIEVLFIKDNLSSNYLELYGLRVAYHIRLSHKLGNRRFMPIVILSDIDALILTRLEPTSTQILLTKNIFLEKNIFSTIEKYKQKSFEPLTNQEYVTQFLNLINIKLPESYADHHDITNEWAIYQWSNLLGGIASEAIEKNTEKISSMLHIKYLMAKYQLNPKTKLHIKQTSKNGRILLVDDKWSDGWKDIIYAFIEEKYSGVDFYVLEDDFKNKTIGDIAVSLSRKIEETNPDVVLLDLRLLRSDEKSIGDEQKLVNELSGIQLLDKIKKINRGIQIIMFTASGDSLILDELHKKNILGYVKKDAPGEKYQAPKNSFDKLDKLIKLGLTNEYLKEIWLIQKNILGLNLLQKNDVDNFAKIKYEVETMFDILDSDLENKIKFAILTIFKTLELLCDEYYNGNSKDGAYIKITSVISKFHLNINDEVSKIICTRNFLIHSGRLEGICEKNAIKNPIEVDIKRWFEMLQTILTEIDKRNNA